MSSNFEQSVLDAVESGVDALLELQDHDGFWREFSLKPGASEAWATGWVGWCLRGSQCRPKQQLRVRESCRKAIARLHASRGAGGWGYSRRTGPDADTNAWVVRFLTSCGRTVEPLVYLKRYVDPGGGVHTFEEPDFGDWTHAHDDVAANAGLAFAEAGRRSREASAIATRLALRFPGETYWWSTPEYGVAWTLRCLAQFGGIPATVRRAAYAWIADRPAPQSAFEIVHRFIALQSLDNRDTACLPLANALLDLAGPAGWPGGAYLLVPPPAKGAPPKPNYELRGIITTALCVRILSEWLTQDNWPVRAAVSR